MAVTQYNADTIPASAKFQVDAAAVALTKRLAAVAGFNAGIAFCADAGAQQQRDYHAAQMELIRVQTEWFKARLAEQDAETQHRATCNELTQRQARAQEALVWLYEQVTGKKAPADNQPGETKETKALSAVAADAEIFQLDKPPGFVGSTETQPLTDV